MSPSVSGGRPLQYFIHHDFDALRMEISGTLAGKAAEEAYDSWRREMLIEDRLPPVIDISYVTGMDSLGQAALRAWREFGARIVTSSSVPTTGNPARAERTRAESAVAYKANAENAGFPMYRELEQPVR